MVNFLKNLLPKSIFFIGLIIEKISRIFFGISTIIYSVSTTLHILFNTETGKKLKEIEKTVEEVMKMYASVANKINSSNKEENRLADLVKSTSNVSRLGKKKNDDTQS